jgi:hypothetical protein
MIAKIASIVAESRVLAILAILAILANSGALAISTSFLWLFFWIPFAFMHLTQPAPYALPVISPGSAPYISCQSFRPGNRHRRECGGAAGW